MTPLTESILNGIKQNDQEAFIAAEESAMAFAFGTGENVGLLDEYLTLLREHPPKKEDIEAIKNALVSYLTSDTQNDYASSAVFALGKIHDPNLLPLFREQLKQVVSRMLANNAILGNLICALEKSGEQVMSENSFCAMEIDKNLRDARFYLKRFEGQSK